MRVDCYSGKQPNYNLDEGLNNKRKHGRVNGVPATITVIMSSNLLVAVENDRASITRNSNESNDGLA